MSNATLTGDEHGNAGYAKRNWTLGILSIALIIIGLDVTVLNVAIPTLQRELNASASGLQWIINAYILVFAGVLLTMGTLGDRFGRRLAFQAGLVIFGLASRWCRVVGVDYAADYRSCSAGNRWRDNHAVDPLNNR
jgi:MFS family permease